MTRLGNDLLRQMVSLHLFGAPFGASHFFLVFLSLFCFSLPTIAGDAVIVKISGTDFRAAHDGLIEAIESEGLVVGGILPFRDMLTRTAVAGDASIPYGEAEIVQFCSGALAAELVREAPEQLTLCPLSVALYSLKGSPADIRLAYRSPGAGSIGRQNAQTLLQRIVERAAELARLRW